MNAIEIILLNFMEVRRRSLILWNGIPEEYLNWKPDEQAFTILEMIRHILEGEHLYHKIIEKRGNLGDYQSPWNEIEYSSLENELRFSEVYRENFMNMITHLSVAELENVIIKRLELGQAKKLGDYLNRIAYHESVHTGQLLGYLRSAGVSRPNIWD